MSGSAQPRLSDLAYDRLKDMIITLELTPGQPMVEKELEERLAVGRMPLRDAVQRLAMEGLVTILARQGTFVAEANVDNLRAMLEMRLLLEPYCARLAARRATPHDVDVLRRVLAEAGQLQARDLPLYKRGLAFHRALGAAAHNEYLAGSLEALITHSMRFFACLRTEELNPDVVADHHIRMVEAVARRDETESATAAREHVDEVCRLLLSAGRPDPAT